MGASRGKPCRCSSELLPIENESLLRKQLVEFVSPLQESLPQRPQFPGA